MTLSVIIVWIFVAILGATFIGTYTAYQLETKDDTSKVTPTVSARAKKHSNANSYANEKNGVSFDFQVGYDPGSFTESREKKFTQWNYNPLSRRTDEGLGAMTKAMNVPTVLGEANTANGSANPMCIEKASPAKPLVYMNVDGEYHMYNFGFSNSVASELYLLCRNNASGIMMLNVAGTGSLIQTNMTSDTKGTIVIRSVTNEIISETSPVYTSHAYTLPPKDRWYVMVLSQPGKKHSAMNVEIYADWAENGTYSMQHVTDIVVPYFDDETTNGNFGISMNRPDSSIEEHSGSTAAFYSRTAHNDPLPKVDVCKDIIYAYDTYEAPTIVYDNNSPIYYVGNDSENMQYSPPEIVKTYPEGSTTLSYSGTLPAGMTFNATNGEFSGTPTQVIIQKIIVTITNTYSKLSNSFTLNMKVLPKPRIQYNPDVYNLLTGIHVNGPTPFLESVTDLVIVQDAGAGYSNTAPPGTVMRSDGSFLGTLTTAGSTKMKITGTSPAGTTVDPVDLTVNVTENPSPPPTIPEPESMKYPSIVAMEYDKSVSIRPVMTGPNEGTFSIYPQLPSGLQFDAVSGTIYGVPQVLLVQTAYTIVYSSDYSLLTSIITISVYGHASVSGTESRVRIGTEVYGTFTFDPSTLNSRDLLYTTIHPDLPEGLHLVGKTIAGIAREVTPETTYYAQFIFDNGVTAEGSVTFSTTSASKKGDALEVTSYAFLGAFVVALIVAIYLQITQK